LGLPHPSQSTVGGPTPCRRRLNIHRQCPKIGMQKPAYPTDCIPIGAHSLCTGPSPSPAPACAGPGLEDATRTVSLALGGGLKTAYVAIPKLRLGLPYVSPRSYRVAASIRPRVFFSKTMAPAIPCGRAGADWGWFFLWLNTCRNPSTWLRTVYCGVWLVGQFIARFSAAVDVWRSPPACCRKRRY
jgi:hypothetical protein